MLSFCSCFACSVNPGPSVKSVLYSRYFLFFQIEQDVQQNREQNERAKTQSTKKNFLHIVIICLQIKKLESK